MPSWTRAANNQGEHSMADLYADVHIVPTPEWSAMVDLLTGKG
jgi:hypothetical protein